MSGMTALKRQSHIKNNRGAHQPIPEGTEIYKNNLYTVVVTTQLALNNKVTMTHLSIKRNGRDPIHDWRDLQWIKNKICGDEAEGVELYPAESRLVDNANQYHLWVLPVGMQWPVGFQAGRLVGDNNQAKLYGAVQRDPQR